MGKRHFTIEAALLAVVSSSALAGDFEDKPFDLRLNLALDRITAFSDVTSRGGASTAHPLGSSANPAADDFLREAPFDFDVLSANTFSYISFDAGAELLGFSTAWLCRPETMGTISLVYVRTDSIDDQGRLGAEYDLGAHELFLGYSKRLRPDLAVGVEAHLMQSSLDVDTNAPIGLLGTDAESWGAELTAGILAALSPQWLVGASASIGGIWTEVDIEAFDPRFAPMPFEDDADFTTFSTGLRAGVGWRPIEQLGLYADAQYRHFGNEGGNVDVGRLFGGVEYMPINALTLRMGGSVDTEGHASAAAGFGLYLIRDVPIEFAYAYDNFPEVSEEFGHSHLLRISVVLLFR